MRTRTHTHSNTVLAMTLALTVTAAGHTPQRYPNRSSSFQWTSNVRERLQILEEHAADAARERMQSDLRHSSCGWSAPRSPAAGDGSVR